MTRLSWSELIDGYGLEAAQGYAASLYGNVCYDIHWLQAYQTALDMVPLERFLDWQAKDAAKRLEARCGFAVVGARCDLPLGHEGAHCESRVMKAWGRLRAR